MIKRCHITLIGEVEKKSLILRFGLGLDCVSFSLKFLDPFVLSVAFSPFCGALVPAPFELREKCSLNGWFWLTR